MAARFLICDDDSPIRRMATGRMALATITASADDEVRDRQLSSLADLLLNEIEVTTELVSSAPAEIARNKSRSATPRDHGR